MEYRKLPHGEELISVIGLGMGYMHESSEDEIEATVRFAIEKGINFFDAIAAEDKPFKPYGRAIKDVRDKVYLQTHLGAKYEGGKYGWTRDLDEIKASFKGMLDALKTDYTDFGFIHCVDDKEDFDKVISSGILDYAKALKAEGTIRHLGFSSHSPEIAKRFLDLGIMDLFMFSINPAYDYKKGQYGLGSVGERVKLYHECERQGVGISVMKPFGGGQLLDAKTSPFGKSLTPYQCMKYALDRTGVLTLLPGARSRQDVETLLGYFEVDDQAKDYSIISEFTPVESEGNCVYCNHCQPCPQGLNIGMMNKYYDLAKAGDPLAEGHYHKLALHASDCIKCGHCEARCPFSVKQESRMDEMATYFGL